MGIPYLGITGIPEFGIAGIPEFRNYCLKIPWKVELGKCGKIKETISGRQARISEASIIVLYTTIYHLNSHRAHIR